MRVPAAVHQGHRVLDRVGAVDVGDRERLAQRHRRSVAAVIAPVSPMPPVVAANSSASLSRETSRTVPSGVTSSKEKSWPAMLPASGWFLPWTSAAIAAAHRQVAGAGDDGEA